MAEKNRTLRQQRSDSKEKKPRRIRVPHRRVTGPLGKAAGLFKKLRIPLPDNKFGRLIRSVGRVLSKVLLIGYLRRSWTEIRQVTWPTRSETIRLTTAVFIFSVILSAIVSVLDTGLDKLFREIIIK